MGGNPIYILLLTGGILGFLVLLFIVTILRHHQRYISLQQERTRNEIVILEKERKRIANDLHDELGPLLSSIRMGLNSLELSSPEDRLTVERSCKRIDDIVNNMRSISYDLLPVTLQRRGLADAIRELAGNHDLRKELEIELELAAGLDLDRETEIHVFRIVQEIMHNTTRHAKATRLRICLLREEEKYTLILEDNGIGFDVKKQQGHGLGLKSIESRAQVLKAGMLLDTAPGRGAFYFFSWEKK